MAPGVLVGIPSNTRYWRTVPLDVWAISASVDWCLMFHNKPEPGDLKALSALLRSKRSQ